MPSPRCASSAFLPPQVSGDEALCPSVVAELSRHLPHAVGMSAASEFNRHPLTAAQGVSFDLLCAVLK